MPYQATVYMVLIASPRDVTEERKGITEVVYAWNAINSNDLGIVLLPVMWETHSAPEMGDRPQAIINRQLVKSCDILIGAFWTRIGTHTGKAESGTVEEIYQFIKDGKPVMIYFSSKPVTPDKLDHEQYKRLMSFKKECQGMGIIEQYGSIDELREKLNRQLTKIIRDITDRPIITQTGATNLLDNDRKTEQGLDKSGEQVHIIQDGFVLDRQKVDILKYLADNIDRSFSAERLTKVLNVSKIKMQYHIELLVEHDYLHKLIGAPPEYKLAKKGRAYLIENNLI